MDVERFCTLRPFLYHLTFAENARLIERDGILRPANAFLSLTDVSQRRTSHVRSRIRGQEVRVRDQIPLVEKAIAFEPGWTLNRLIKLLNAQVFFWPGTADGPMGPGMKHIARYRMERPIVIRVPSRDIVFGTSRRYVRFSRYNSGAPRFSGGNPSPRGSRTFLPAVEFEGGIKQVIEVAIASEVRLPSNMECLSAQDF